MKKLLVLITGLLMTAGAQAQTANDIKEGSDILRLLVGSTRQATTAGLEYERRSGAFGVGARYIFMGEESNIARYQSNTLALQLTSHLYDRSDLDVYVSAGLGATMFKDVQDNLATPPTTDDYTTFGPTLGIGFLYTLNANWAVGLDYYNMYNWFTRELPGQNEISSAVLSYSF